MQRIPSLDLARGFTVLFIPIVHSAMIYGSPEVHRSILGEVLMFIAEWPGAQVFMILMGVCFELAKPKRFGLVLFRSFALIICGYLLNVLKFVIPYLAGWLPNEFMNDINADGWKSLLLIGDILQFAGISLLILFGIQRTPDRPLVALLLTIFVCFATPFPYNSNLHIMELATGGPPHVFFPLFPWLVYPLAGLVIGHSIKEYGDRVLVALLPIGGGLMLSSFCAKLTFSIEPDQSFYRMGPWSTLMHLGFVLVWISGFHFLSKIRWNVLFQMLEWLSKRITLIYLIQWPVICWLIPVFGYHQLSVWECVVIGIDITLITFIVVHLLSRRPHTNPSHPPSPPEGGGRG